MHVPRMQPARCRVRKRNPDPRSGIAVPNPQGGAADLDESTLMVLRRHWAFIHENACAATDLPERYLIGAMRRPSRSTRLLRSLTALVTVWCLGCSAFDPFITSLIPGGSRMMVCASEGPETVQSVMQDHASISAPADRDAGDGATCGCGSCNAPAPTGFVVAAPPRPVPYQAIADPLTPPSVARTPLVPPPQRAA